MPPLPRSIAHLDMDAFYASVELLRAPELRGLPVVVGGRRALTAAAGETHPRLRDYVGRGVITTATYEARALGVHSGMGLMKAAQLAPDAVLLPADFEAYRHYSQRFKQAVRAIAPEVEDRGIDEIYLDLSAHNPDGSVAGARALALRLQQAVRDATGLSCSLGVAPNKLLAKLCSDLDKPAGITVVTLDELPTRIWPLPARRIQVAGDVGIATFKMLLVNMLEGRFISPYDNEIAERIATILCGGKLDRGAWVDEEWLLTLERTHFVALAQQEKTQARIAHMLKTGKPLRN